MLEHKSMFSYGASFLIGRSSILGYITLLGEVRESFLFMITSLCMSLHQILKKVNMFFVVENSR